MRRFLTLAVVAALALGAPAMVALAQGFTFEVPKTTLELSQVGTAELRVQVDEEGKTIEFRVDDREYSGMDVEVVIGGESFTAHHLFVTSNLRGEDHMADHDGTITAVIGSDEVVLEYAGEATLFHRMHHHVIKSSGDFRVVDGTGVFEDLKGTEGTYYMKIVEHGMTVGSEVGFVFSAEEVGE